MTESERAYWRGRVDEKLDAVIEGISDVKKTLDSHSRRLDTIERRGIAVRSKWSLPTIGVGIVLVSIIEILVRRLFGG